MAWYVADESETLGKVEKSWNEHGQMDMFAMKEISKKNTQLLKLLQ